MADMRLALVFINTARAGEIVLLPQGETSIGRSRSNPIVLEDPLVSRQHLRLLVTGEAVLAEDLDSAHGTFLNDKRVRGSVSLNSGDVIQLGDIKLKFTIGQIETETCTAFVDGSQSAPSPSNATECAQAPSCGETRFMKQQPPPAEDDAERTRVIGNGETRLMDGRELRGLRATPAAPAPRKKVLYVLAFVAVLVVIAIAFRLSGTAQGAGRGGKAVSYASDQYALSLSAPAGWKLTQGVQGALFGFETRVQDSDEFPHVNVFADRRPDYALTGLRAAFEAYAEIIAARHPGLRFKGNMLMTVNNVTGVFYAFESQKRSGKGLFLLSGNKLICAECSCSRTCTNVLVKVFPAILRTFRLTEPQQFIDFPPPTEAVRRMALANSDHLAAMSKRDLESCNNLLKNRHVRPENLYLAKRAIESCMTTASALGERPAFYGEAATRLAEATRALEDGLRDQKFKVIMAEQRRDIDQAYWESLKLSQMIPEKTSDYYQYAAKRVDFYAKLREQ